MKVIIAGSRDITDISVVAPILTEAFVQLNIVKPPEIVSGGAKGVDHIGEIFAKHIGYDLKVFPADWNKHGKAAGPIRNRQMAEYTDCAILFPGNKGTDSMRREMKIHNKKILYDAKE